MSLILRRTKRERTIWWEKEQIITRVFTSILHFEPRMSKKLGILLRPPTQNATIQNSIWKSKEEELLLYRL